MRYSVKSSTNDQYIGKIFTLDMAKRTIDFGEIDGKPNTQKYLHVRGNDYSVNVITESDSIVGKLL